MHPLPITRRLSITRSPDLKHPCVRASVVDSIYRTTSIFRTEKDGEMAFNDKQLVLALKAVADPARLKILRLLKQKGQCSIGKRVGMCACDVQDHIRLSQPTISHHMAILRKAGLVVAEKHGLWTWYRRDEKTLKGLGQAISSF